MCIAIIINIHSFYQEQIKPISLPAAIEGDSRMECRMGRIVIDWVFSFISQFLDSNLLLKPSKNVSMQLSIFKRGTGKSSLDSV